LRVKQKVKQQAGHEVGQQVVRQSKQGCPVQATVNVMRGKWKVGIIWNLAFGPKRFAEVRARLKGVSEKVLVAQLRQLEKDGVVSRIVIPGAVAKVTYSMTKPGMQLVSIMQELCDWGSAHFGIRPTMGTPPALRRGPTHPRML
jgi:DNA-binding HxlR family transcriptional regulator